MIFSSNRKSKRDLQRKGTTDLKVSNSKIENNLIEEINNSIDDESLFIFNWFIDFIIELKIFMMNIHNSHHLNQQLILLTRSFE